jgi:transposase
MAGLRVSGLIAPFIPDGPMIGEAFRAYVEQFLAPALAPGEVAVMDKLSGTRVAGITQAIAAIGASICIFRRTVPI